MYILEIGGPAIHKVSPPGTDYLRWSPDGTQLAFTCSEEGMFIPEVSTGYHPTRIYVMRLETSEVAITRPVVDTLMSVDIYPSWSPDGERILFSSNQNPTEDLELYTMNPDGGEVTRITETTIHEYLPVWSPDGTKIAFTSGEGEWSIYTMDADGSNILQITNALSKNPPEISWSPDGSRLAFTSDHDGTLRSMSSTMTAPECNDLPMIRARIGSLLGLRELLI